VNAATTRTGSDWRLGFLFLGNHLALDFLNTRPLMDGQLTDLLSDFDALLTWFQAAGVLRSTDAELLRQRWGGSNRARRTLEAARALRESLREEILSWEGGAALHHTTLEELNRLMAAYPMRTRLKANREGVSAERWFEIEQPESLLAPLADSAAALFADADRDRVRKCDQCVLHFLDTSKKGTRRWCSMQFCGNRMKVAAYTARHRK
jgi:predicted RNA-binding Zn ribbon-like protein